MKDEVSPNIKPTSIIYDIDFIGWAVVLDQEGVSLISPAGEVLKGGYLPRMRLILDSVEDALYNGAVSLPVEEEDE